MVDLSSIKNLNQDCPLQPKSGKGRHSKKGQVGPEERGGIGKPAEEPGGHQNRHVTQTHISRHLGSGWEVTEAFPPIHGSSKTPYSKSENV